MSGRGAAGGPIPYGYDRATNTVRVSAHDLARLLLQFREEIGKSRPPGDWRHMADYDISFERLADAVDYANGARSAVSGWGRNPDYRMRCDRGEVYEWPEDAGRELVSIRERTDDSQLRDLGTHYACPLPGRLAGEVQTWRALCGLTCFSGGDAGRVRPASGEPSCRECARELALAAHLAVTPVDPWYGPHRAAQAGERP